MKFFRGAAILALLSSAATLTAQEHYIVPIWGHAIQGANATYNSTIAATNLGEKPSHFRVTKVMPTSRIDASAETRSKSFNRAVPQS